MNTDLKSNGRILVIDVETTGFDSVRSACIELGAVLLNEELSPIDEFGSEIQPWPGAEIYTESVAVSGIDLTQISKFPSQSEVLEAFSTFCGQSTPMLAGWNVWFDVSFLKEMYRRSNLNWPFSHRLLDVQSVVAFFHRLQPVSQEKVIREYLGKKQTHRALNDARNTADILRLFYKRFSPSSTALIAEAKLEAIDRREPT